MNKHCEVRWKPDAGLVTFTVLCFYEGVVRYELDVLQTEIGVTMRRWLYMGVSPNQTV